ncbi:glycosyltransferase [Aliivibrio finisterrensis]|uniref:Glycosyltransferase n=1 Tax=Aliivibrio finisterrensis TaxID=511998 RepID=A0A4Q5KDD3_9GAMM|nr:glycosyltransferase [Aliivibrio finisterrensis]RYU44048.1 glycosyltransferase [Aliivibrio finisterrensis]
MEVKRKVTIVGPFLYPWGQASSRRVHGLARSLAVNFDVDIICGNTKNIKSDEDEGIRYQGVGYETGSETYLSKFIRVIGQNAIKTVGALRRKSNKPDFIIVYGGHFLFMLPLLFWAKINDIKIIVDVVEWYDKNQLTGGRYGPVHINAKLALKYVYPRVDGIIAISSYLNSYYEKKGLHTIVIPPISNFQSCRTQQTLNQPRKLIYSGYPGIKDNIHVVIEALKVINNDNIKLELLILSPKINSNYTHLSFVDVITNIDQKNVAKYLSQADFSLMFREDKVFTKAGFPTKFVESMCVGTPVIGNITSDLDRYLINGETGFISSTLDVNEIVEIFNNVVQLNVLEMQILRENCKIMAENFRYFKYTSKLKEFFNLI